MKKSRLILILLALICSNSFQTYSQESRIENTVLELQGTLLSITYDIMGTKPLENVWLEISTSKGIKIEAKSLLGDIGKNIEPGIGKRIIWDMKKDYPDLQGEELNIKVLAQKPEENKVSNNTFSEIKEEFVPEKQNKSRDIVYLKNGSKVKGLLTKRFAIDAYKFISVDGNSLTYKASDIDKITNNGLSKEEITLKNGDKVKGNIIEIDPNDKLQLKSKTGDKYFFNIVDIDKITTFRVDKHWMFASDASLGSSAGLIGLRIGYLNNWGGYLCGRISDGEGTVEDAFSIGGSKRLLEKRNFIQYIYSGIGFGLWGNHLNSYPWGYVNKQEGLIIELGTNLRFNRIVANIGIAGGNAFDVTFGIGYLLF